MSFAFVPVYIKLLGLESYGLIAIFFVLQASLQLLDLGLGGAVTREVSKRRTALSETHDLTVLLKTVQLLYYGAAILSGLILFAFSSEITEHWLNKTTLDHNFVIISVQLMALMVSIQFPLSFYSGIIIGSQSLVELNKALVLFATLRGVGSVLVLLLIAPNVHVFFSWQIFVSIINLVIFHRMAWGVLPSPKEAVTIDIASVKTIWRFTAGMTGIALTSTVLTQVDKMIVSSKYALEIFAYYSLASIFQTVLLRLIAPIYSVIFPKFTECVTEGDEEKLAKLYHKIAQFVATLIFPVASTMAFFSYELISIWTHDSDLAVNSYRLAVAFTAATAISCVMYVPYAVQLAYGFTKLSFFTNIISSVLLPLLLISLVERLGPIGAPISHFVLNFAVFVITPVIMHRRFLRGEALHWYLVDNGIPLMVALTAGAIFKFFFVADASDAQTLAYIALAGAGILIATIMATPNIRFIVLSRLIPTSQRKQSARPPSS